MKKNVYVGLFSAMLLVGGTAVTTFAEETEEDVKTEEVVQEQTNDVKPNLGKVTLIAYGKNEDNQDFSDYRFSVPKPAEFQGLKSGELSLVNVPQNAEDKTLLGYTDLYHTVFDGKFDTSIRYGIYDEGDQLVFKPALGNINVGQANYPGKVGLTPFIGGVINDNAPFFETPNGTYSAFIRLIFTNVAQPGEDGQENINNDAVDESSNQPDTPENPTEPLGSENNPTGNKVDKQNEKEFVENIKKDGDTSEKYADNKKLPQTSQSNTALSGLMLLLIGSATAVFAKFKFSTK